MDDDICRLPASRLGELIRRREVSPVALMRAVLARTGALQPVLNGFVSIFAAQATAEAAAAEAAVMRGDRLGLLHGVPCSVKDIVETAGQRTTFGSRLFADNVPAADAEAVARLRRAGAIVFGKTTTPEFGAKCLTDAPLFGRTRNAWSAAHTSGGSSGGAAVAVASGLGPIAVATDGGGSTRIPASCNGVVGLKQSLGVVPHSQVADAFGNYTYVTPMTRTVADTALMLQAMAGPHASDPWSLGRTVPDYVAAAAGQGDLAGRRILVCARPGGRKVAAEVAAAFDAALVTLAGLGATLAEMPPVDLDVEPVWRAINHTTWRARFADMAARDGARMSPSLLRQLALAADVTGVDYQRAMFARARLFRAVQELFDAGDFLVMPTLTRTALPIGQELFEPIAIDDEVFDDLRPAWFPATMPFNLTGHPAVSLPMGFSAGGFGAEALPIGLQLVGRCHDEAGLLHVAALFEAAQDWRGAWPEEPVAPG
jgi:aspartyl-tRNA(Asn)/glutamyl-tRNA(Gln) amidotransferase subunit A